MYVIDYRQALSLFVLLSVRLITDKLFKTDFVSENNTPSVIESTQLKQFVRLKYGTVMLYFDILNND